MKRKFAAVYHRETSYRIANRKLTQEQIDAYRAAGHHVMVPGENGVIAVPYQSAHTMTGKAPSADPVGRRRQKRNAHSKEHAVKIRIVGAEAREITAHVNAYVKPGRSWSEVQSMGECGHGCKLHVRSQGGVREYQLWHSTVYGCSLGRDESTRAVPVSIVLNG